MATTGAASATGPTLRERGRVVSAESPRLSTPSFVRRRSSILSYASDTRHSVHSSATDFILPGLGIDTSGGSEDEASHWHSSPLAFAILPAIGGVFFTNGSAVITDILLLGLAAIFLNWSVRLPWQWYHSAQAIRREPRLRSTMNTHPTDAQTAPSSTSSAASAGTKGNTEVVVEDEEEESEDRQEAADKLRTHEKMALLATFVLPAMGAYMLHVIRGQLSKGSTALVSDYNLTIFLLAAEIRPFRQLIKLFTNRTLHLQRVANGSDQAVGASIETNAEFESRLEVLEAKVGDPTLATAVGPGQKEEMVQLAAEMRKRYEPRIDALERAVRRYEKRVTTLTMLTDQRLQLLDSRLQDTLSLAAVAAQSSQKPSVVAATASYFARVMMMPLEAGCFFILWPVRVMEDTIKVIIGRDLKSKKRAGDRSGKTTSRPVKGRNRDEISAVPPI